MPDNTRLNPGTGGDLVRAVDRTGSGPVTQVLQLDVGSAGLGNETLLTQGQKTMSGSVPVALASDQSALPVRNEEIATSATLTNSTGTVQASVSVGNAVTVQLDGTHAGLNVTFEISNDGTNWDLVSALRSGTSAPVTATGVLTSNSTTIWQAYCGGAAFFRVRSTAYTSGTLNVRIRALSIGAPTIIVVQPSGTQAVSGTVTANIGTGSVAAGTNAIGDVGIQARANATGAASTSHIVSAAGTNAANVKSSAGRLLGWSLVNTTASWQYVKLHNTAAAPTAGAGVVQTISIPPNGVNTCPPTLPGIAFATGIGRSIVTGSADADATATTAGAVVGDLFFA